VIPDEAVEAAARALDPYTMGIETATNAEHRQAVRQEVIRALEAAAPHLMRAAWDEGYDRAESDHYGTGFWTKRLRGNPYGKPTNAD
jgi:hypothetical protein